MSRRTPVLEVMAAGVTAKVKENAWKEPSAATADESRLSGDVTRCFVAMAGRRAPFDDGCDKQRVIFGCLADGVSLLPGRQRDTAPGEEGEERPKGG
jgi:hypothetical protein